MLTDQLSFCNTANNVATYIFTSAPITLNTSKQIASITLSDSVNQGALHIFAMTIS
jgi:hypothetical protein